MMFLSIIYLNVKILNVFSYFKTSRGSNIYNNLSNNFYNLYNNHSNLSTETK